MKKIFITLSVTLVFAENLVPIAASQVYSLQLEYLLVTTANIV